MKQIVNYINEKLHVTSKSFYTCQPKTKDDLQESIIQRIQDDGQECNLNDIDVSKITDMSDLFNANQFVNGGHKIFDDFNGDISLWDVSHVTNMTRMFDWCRQFNCDLSRWNVSNVKNMKYMFNSCVKFNCDLSDWDVSNVKNIEAMFYGCKNFNQNLDEWNISNVKTMFQAFKYCPTQPEWYEWNK